MATGTLAIQNEDLAREWLSKCKANEKQLYELTQQLGQLLDYVGKSAEGDIVDKFIEFGAALTKEAGHLFEAVSAVSNAVSGLLQGAKDAVGGILGILGKIAGIG